MVTLLPRVVPAIVVALSVTSLFAIANIGCSKRCDTAEGCRRTCKCTDSANGVTFDCPMTFNCNSDDEVCDKEHDKSCDEICDSYAAYNACGRQCENDAQCFMRCECETEGGGTVVCENAFACEKEHHTCEEAHRLTSCELMCEICYVGP